MGFVLILLFLPQLAVADMGPKPTADITLTYEGETIQEPVFGQLIECYPAPNQPDANELEYETRSIVGRDNIFDNKTIVEILSMNVFDSARNCYWRPAGLAWGGCSKSGCSFRYSIPDTFKLVVYLPSKEKVFMTNEIESQWFNGKYAADLKQDGTGVIQEAMPFPPQSREVWSILLFAMISICVQFMAGMGYFKIRFKLFLGWLGLGYIILANLLSSSVIIALKYVSVGSSAWLFLLPILPLLFISLIFYAKYRELFDNYRKAFEFSLWLNALSFLPAVFMTLLI